MSEDKPPLAPKKGGPSKKPKWLLEREEREAKLKERELEGKADDKKENDATDMFSRSKDSYRDIRAAEKRKEEKRKEEKKSKPAREDSAKSKRRRVSTEQEDEDAGAPARKT
jgi:hypothetical protein